MKTFKIIMIVAIYLLIVTPLTVVLVDTLFNDSKITDTYISSTPNQATNNKCYDKYNKEIVGSKCIPTITETEKDISTMTICLVFISISISIIWFISNVYEC